MIGTLKGYFSYLSIGLFIYLFILAMLCELKYSCAYFQLREKGICTDSSANDEFHWMVNDFKYLEKTFFCLVWVHSPAYITLKETFFCVFIFSLSCAFTTLSVQAKPWKPWNFCLRTMIHMMQLNGGALSILLNTFHITSQSFNLYDAWEFFVQWKYLHMSLFWPEA